MITEAVATLLALLNSPESARSILLLTMREGLRPCCNACPENTKISAGENTYVMRIHSRTIIAQLKTGQTARQYRRIASTYVLKYKMNVTSPGKRRYFGINELKGAHCSWLLEWGIIPAWIANMRIIRTDSRVQNSGQGWYNFQYWFEPIQCIPYCLQIKRYSFQNFLT